MRLLICAFVLNALFCSNLLSSGYSQPFTINSKQLADTEIRARFLDPHNHIGGVLPPLALVDLEKYIRGELPSDSQMADFWERLVKAYDETPAVKDNGRMSAMAKMVMTCNKPATLCQNDLNEPCVEALKRTIADVLTSSPVTTFWTAYAFREMVNKDIIYGKLKKDALKQKKDLYAQANLFELAKKNVALVEMSVSAIGGSRPDNAIFKQYRDLIDDLKSNDTKPNHRELKQSITEKGLVIPEIKWLLMMHTMELGKLLGGDTLNYHAQRRCSVMKMPEALNTDPVLDGLFDTLLYVKDVVGVDVAGAESTCFTDDGMDVFENLSKTVYYAARERQRLLNNKGRLIVRAHVGEGAPVFDVQQAQERSEACAAIEVYPAPETAYDDTGYRTPAMRPVHEIEATKNIAHILDAIANLKEQFPDIDDYVVFRLAHLTYITKELAKQAKDLGITADVNLSSNVSTGAEVIPFATIKKYLIDHGIKADDTDGMITTMLKNGAQVEEFIPKHGLKWLLYYHIPVLLGSDGSGLENSPSMNQEYFLARKLIEYWQKTDAEFRNRNVSIDDLLYNQQLHYERMGY